MQGWWFSRESRCLGYDDGRLAKKGVTHSVYDKIELCQHGLHASENILDALSYAPGNILWKVDLFGELILSHDKMVARNRIYLTEGIDISNTLEKFTVWCALKIMHLWSCPPTVKYYLETRDAAARAPVYDAAYVAAYVAAYAAARAPAYAAARAEQNAKLTEMVESLLGEM